MGGGGNVLLPMDPTQCPFSGSCLCSPQGYQIDLKLGK